MQCEVARAVDSQQRIVEPTDRAGRVAVAHPGVDALEVDRGQQAGQLVERGDAELEQQPGDPRVVVGARPTGVLELAGKEGREVGGADPRVVLVHGQLLATHRRLQGVADLRELPVRQLQQPGREGEPAVEVGHMLLGDGPLVADVVLELGPRVLQDRAHLHRGAARQHLVCRGHALDGVDRHEQVAAGVAEPALAGRLATHVAVVEDAELVGQQTGHRIHVAVQVGHHPDADLVGDLGEGVRVDLFAIQGPRGLGGERGHRLGASGDADVVDAGVVEQRGDEGDELLRAHAQVRLQRGILLHRVVHGLRLWSCRGFTHERQSAAYWPVRPSMRSRMRSAWPQCRAYSSIRWTSSSRSEMAFRVGWVLISSRESAPSTKASA